MTLMLAIQTALPALLTSALTLAEKRGLGRGMPERARQLVIGLLFGAAAVFATETGVPVVDGGVVNVRDAAPLVAGLAFGAPAGIVAGIVGAAERWMCVWWGGGMTTRVACSLATLAAGLAAAAFRKLFFGDRRPLFVYGLGIGVTTEVLHMLLVLLTNMGDLAAAFEYVRACSLTMIVLNGLACGAALLGQGYLYREALRARPPYLIRDLGSRVLAVILAGFLGTSAFTVRVTQLLAADETGSQLQTSLDDIEANVGTFGWSGLTEGGYTWHVERSGAAVVYDPGTGRVASAQGRGSTLGDVGVDGDELARLQGGGLVELTAFGERRYAMMRDLGAYSVIAYVSVGEADYFSDALLYLMVFMEVLVYTALFVILFQLLRRRVVDNIKTVEKGLAAITAGDLDTQIDVRTHQEFSALSDDVNATVAALRGYIEDAERRMDADLALARQIQRAALPSVFPPYPDRGDFDLYARMDPAREVGGDFYDFFMLDGHTLVFEVADVSGKGVPAALFMMRAKTELRALMESGMDVDEALGAANGRLCEQNDSGMFVTAWLAKLDLATGDLAYANAGHNPPLVLRAGGSYEYLRAVRPSLFLAGMEGTRYRKGRLTLGPGDKLFLYTDGVTEACDPHEAMYGEKRLVAALDAAAGEGPRSTCEAVAASVAGFAAGAERSDDVTMLAVDVYALRSRDRIVTQADRASLELVHEFFSERLPRLGADGRTAARVQVAVDEAYSNVCAYAHATRAVASVLRKGADLVVELADDGVAFDPTAAPEPDLSLGARERPIGGLGIHMLRRLSRSMAYARVDGTNILTLTFFAGQAPEASPVEGTDR